MEQDFADSNMCATKALKLAMLNGGREGFFPPIFPCPLGETSNFVLGALVLTPIESSDAGV